MEIRYTCRACHLEKSIVIADEYANALNEWMNGSLIQNTRLIELPVEIREALITQTCPECQAEIDKMLIEMEDMISDEDES